MVLALVHLQGDLKNVEGLVEVKEVLEAKKEVNGLNQGRVQMDIDKKSMLSLVLYNGDLNNEHLNSGNI